MQGGLQGDVGSGRLLAQAGGQRHKALIFVPSLPIKTTC